MGEVYEFIKSENTYHFDPTHVVFAGSSVGAHYMAQSVTIQASKEYAALLGIQQTVPLQNITAALLYCGPYNFERFGTESRNVLVSFMAKQAMWAYFGVKDWRGQYGKSATLQNHVTAVFPPTFITDGNTGSFERDGKELEETLREWKVSVESYYVDINKETIGH